MMCCPCIVQEMQYYGLTRGRAVTIPLDGKFQRIMLDPEVVKQLLKYSTYYKYFLVGKQAATPGNIPRGVSDVCAGTAEFSQQPAHSPSSPSPPQTTHSHQAAVGGAERGQFCPGSEGSGEASREMCVEILFILCVCVCFFSMG